MEKTEIPLTEEQEMARDIEGVFGGIAEGISQSGKNKVNEYAERIMNGEILEGVGDAIRNSVRQEVERKELETKARGIVKVRIMDNSNPIVQDYERYIKKIRELEESISIRDKE
ncbi:MAG: hypothetical protein LBU14_05170 [Candidatus Peribacteria bacterium]|nr:hypothetical protein [Candidatus Peribacteria bacterium]